MNTNTPLVPISDILPQRPLPSVPPQSSFGSTVWNASLLSGVVLFFVTIVSIGIYTATAGKHIANDSQSEDKITVLQQAFQSFLGPRWPYVLLVFTIVLGLMLYFLYLATTNEVLTINMSDIMARRFNIAFIFFVIIFGISMILLAIKQYLDYRKTQATGNIPAYTPNINQQKTIIQILGIVGLGLFILIGGGFAVWFILLN